VVPVARQHGTASFGPHLRGLSILRGRSHYMEGGGVASVAHLGPVHFGLDVHNDAISVGILDPDQQVPDVERIIHDEVSVRRLVGRLGDPADQRGVAVGESRGCRPARHAGVRRGRLLPQARPRARHLAGRFRRAGLQLAAGACDWPQWNQPEPVAQLLNQAAPGRPPPPLMGEEHFLRPQQGSQMSSRPDCSRSLPTLP
jgi:hypothetical protein